MALGGVATGNMNANEAHAVAGIIKYIGLTPILCPYKSKYELIFINIEFMIIKMSEVLPKLVFRIIMVNDS